MKNILLGIQLSLLVFLLTNCQQGSGNGAAIEITGFETMSIAGGAGTKAVKKDANGKVIEEGILINGAKNGSWITYHPNKEKAIKTLANYVNDELNGVFLTISDRGQIETLTTYANGEFNGNYVKFRFGNVEETGIYVNGQLDGLYKKFYPTRKVQIEAEYKNGKQHGNYKYYDENGAIVMEYEYENGEKVSGGMKEK